MDFYWHNNIGSKLKDWHKKENISVQKFHDTESCWYKRVQTASLCNGR